MTFIIFPNQLFEDTGIFRQHSHVILIEEPIYFYDPVHRPIRPNKIKIAYMRACMRWYHDFLKSHGISVTYVEYEEVLKNGYRAIQGPISYYDVTDHALANKLQSFHDSHVIASPNFLMPISYLEEYAHIHKTPRHATFYDFVKTKLNILPGIKSQDKLNRQPPPKNVQVPNRIKERYDKGSLKPYYEEAQEYSRRSCFAAHPGDAKEIGLYPITHRDSYASFKVFLKERFAEYGPYQDAIMQDQPFMYHSVISPMLNIGLLDPNTILKMIMSNTQKVPLNSLEGLVRQIIGWREYMRYLYIARYDDIKKANLPKNNMTFKDIEAWYKGETGVYPLDNEIKKAMRFGYAHHIIRLMVFMNFFILCEIHPSQIYKWFMEVVAIDAYDWVMTSNIYAMGYGQMRKPYITTCNYILKMSNYKKDGYWDSLWTQLFHRFIAIKPATYVGYYKRLVKDSSKRLIKEKDMTHAFLKKHTKTLRNKE